MVDTVSHGLWSLLLFHRAKDKRKTIAAIFFGIMPDIFSWTIYASYLIIAGAYQFGHRLPVDLPMWAELLFHLSHSLVTFVIVAAIVYLIFRKIPLYLLMWPLHIVIDVPTHPIDHFPTPFLWPMSNWEFPGVYWGLPWMLMIEWVLLISLCLYFLVWKRMKLKKEIRETEGKIEIKTELESRKLKADKKLNVEAD